MLAHVDGDAENVTDDDGDGEMEDMQRVMIAAPSPPFLVALPPKPTATPTALATGFDKNLDGHPATRLDPLMSVADERPAAYDEPAPPPVCQPPVPPP